MRSLSLHYQVDDEDKVGQQYIYIVAFGLLLAAFVTLLCSRLNMQGSFPITMFCFGLLLGGVAKDREGYFLDATNNWAGIQPFLLYYIFVPLLAFSHSLHIKWIDLKHTFKKALLIGICCVLTNTVFISLLMKGFQREWSWSLLIIFGVCLSFSDPASVSPVMKSAGASHGLITLLVGESIISEGSSAVMFHLFERKLTEDDFGAGDVAFGVFNEFIFSVLIGVVAGEVVNRVMSFANQNLRNLDTIMQNIIAVACSYIVFFSAQTIGGSGVIVTSTMGIYMASFGEKTILDPHWFAYIWETLEWCSSALIFLFAGIIVEQAAFQEVGPKIIWQVILLFITSTVVRTLTLLAFQVTQLEKVSKNEAIFVGSFGLRGSMGLIFSLVVYSLSSHHGTHYITQDEADQFILYATAVILMSMLQGASLTRHAINYFGLSEKETRERRLLQKVIRHQVRLKLKADMKQLKSERFGEGEEDFLSKSSLLAKEPDDIRALCEFIGELARNDRSENKNLRKEIRRSYFDCVRRCYLDFVKIGKLPRHSFAAQALLNAVTLELDREDTCEVNDLYLLLDYCQLFDIEVFLYEHLVDPFFSFIGSKLNMMRRREAIMEKRSIYSLLCFIEAHQSAQATMNSFFQGISSFHPSPNIREINDLVHQSATRIAEANLLLRKYKDEDVKFIVHSQNSACLLHTQGQYIAELSHSGAITGKYLDDMLQSIIDDKAKIERFRKHKTIVFKGKYSRRDSNVTLRLHKTSQTKSSEIGLAAKSQQSNMSPLHSNSEDPATTEQTD